MNKSFWDERYSIEEYIYGTEPNEFFKQQIDLMDAGKLLLPGEGEGRNAVYAASKGWFVDAVDFSIVAKEKALKLAELKSVSINYFISDLEEFQYPKNYYDVVGLFYVHLSDDLRATVNEKIIDSLRVDGLIIFEAFNKSQINNNSGGPKDINLLYDENDIFLDFKHIDILMLESISTELNEGNYHKGKADVIRFVGKKK